jgi:hypothetical protein
MSHFFFFVISRSSVRVTSLAPGFQGVRTDGPGPFFVFQRVAPVGAVGGPDSSAIPPPPLLPHLACASAQVFWNGNPPHFKRSGALCAPAAPDARGCSITHAPIDSDHARHARRSRTPWARSVSLSRPLPCPSRARLASRRKRRIRARSPWSSG